MSFQEITNQLIEMNTTELAAVVGYDLVKVKSRTNVMDGDELLCQLTKKELSPWLFRSARSHLMDAANPTEHVEEVEQVVVIVEDTQLSLF